MSDLLRFLLWPFARAYWFVRGAYFDWTRRHAKAINRAVLLARKALEAVARVDAAVSPMKLWRIIVHRRACRRLGLNPKTMKADPRIKRWQQIGRGGWFNAATDPDHFASHG